MIHDVEVKNRKWAAPNRSAAANCMCSVNGQFHRMNIGAVFVVAKSIPQAICSEHRSTLPSDIHKLQRGYLHSQLLNLQLALVSQYCSGGHQIRYQPVPPPLTTMKLSLIPALLFLSLLVTAASVPQSQEISAREPAAEPEYFDLRGFSTLEKRKGGGGGKGGGGSSGGKGGSSGSSGSGRSPSSYSFRYAFMTLTTFASMHLFPQPDSTDRPQVRHRTQVAEQSLALDSSPPIMAAMLVAPLCLMHRANALQRVATFPLPYP
jgi:hypothetical protein